jgi:hypothetical protein
MGSPTPLLLGKTCLGANLLHHSALCPFSLQFWIGLRKPMWPPCLGQVLEASNMGDKSGTLILPPVTCSWVHTLPRPQHRPYTGEGKEREKQIRLRGADGSCL